MRPTLALACASFAFAACASLVEQECRTDAYELGVRDARRALPPQAETHVAQCKTIGVEIDAARYLEGWRSAYRFHPFGA